MAEIDSLCAGLAEAVFRWEGQAKRNRSEAAEHHQREGLEGVLMENMCLLTAEICDTHAAVLRGWIAQYSPESMPELKS